MLYFRALLIQMFLLLLATPQMGQAGELPRQDRVATGYIDRDGRFAIKPQFSIASDFSEGMACAQSLNSPETVVVDIHGKVLFKEPVYRLNQGFSNGLLLVKRNSRWGYLNKNGDVAIPFRYIDAQPFQGSIAFVVLESGQTVMINQKGDRVFHKVTFRMSEPRYGGLRRPLGDLERGNVSEGLQWVRHHSKDGSNLCFVDECQQICFGLGPEFEMVGDFHEGLASVLVKRDGIDALGRSTRHNLGFIDRTGKLVIPAKFTVDEPARVFFSDGLARLKIDADTCCYVDKKGRVIGPFYDGGIFHCGRALASVVVDRRGRSLMMNEKKFGCQSRTRYTQALRAKLAAALKDLKSENEIVFTVQPAESGLGKVVLICSSGNSDFEKQCLQLVERVPSPKRGLLQQCPSPLLFRVKNGAVSNGFNRDINRTIRLDLEER